MYKPWASSGFGSWQSPDEDETIKIVLNINETMVKAVVKVVNLTNHWMFEILQQQNLTNCLLVLCLVALVMNLTLNLKHKAIVEEPSTAFNPESSKSVC
jgi:hypothetical protein